jgi:hypothetical protein
MILPMIVATLGLSATALGAILGRSGRSDSKPEPKAPTSVALQKGAARLARFKNFVEKYRGEIPSWLLYGHMAVENSMPPPYGSGPTTQKECAGTAPNDCASLKRLKGCLDERGYMGISRQTSCDKKWDHARMVEPEYSIAKGADMYRTYASALLKNHTFSSPDDLWRTAYLLFAIGAGGAAKFIPATASGLTWTQVASNIADYCKRVTCSHSILAAFSNNELVWQKGHAIASLAASVA